MYRYIPLDTGRKLNVHKTFRRRPEHLLNVLNTFNLRPVSAWIVVAIIYFQGKIYPKQYHSCFRHGFHRCQKLKYILRIQS